MSAMTNMSRAIRLELEKSGTTLRDISDLNLGEYTTIIGAFYEDLKDEIIRRQVITERPDPYEDL